MRHILAAFLAGVGCSLELEECDGASVLQQRSTRISEEMSLREAVHEAGLLAKKLSKDEIAGLVRGVGYNDSVYNPPLGYFVGNSAPVPRLGIPSLNLQDNGQGYRTVSKEVISLVTAFPSTLAVAATWDRKLGFAWGQALGEEFHGKGANVLLGPGLNVHRVARNGRNVEYLSGESGYLGAELVQGYIKGVHSKHVVTVMKHFIANSQETMRSFVDPKIEERALFEVYYPPFQAAIDAGCLSAMCSYNLVNGAHACSNSVILQQHLRDAMGYQGWVMSDWWALHNFSAEQGLDQEMPGNSCEGNPMNKAYFTEENLATLSSEKLQQMATRILTPVVRYGLMEYPVCAPEDSCYDEIYKKEAPHRQAHGKLARRMVAESVMLLKNKKEVLPISPDVQSIAVLGSACDADNNIDAMLDKWDLGNYYTVGGSGRVIPEDPRSVQEGIEDACEAAGCTVSAVLVDDVEAALAAAENADLVVVCAATTSQENADRESLSVDQEPFVVELTSRLSKPSVVVSMIPGTIVMPWIEKVDAAVAVFLAGQATGDGIADVLFGKVNPGAKSPVTFPLKEEDAIAPCDPPVDFEEVPKNSYPCEYAEGLKAGFPYYEDKDVLFPFGHGLSYTTFSYGALSISPCGAECASVQLELRNTGPVAGAEVVQLYLVFPEGLGEPKHGVLRGFQKVFLEPNTAQQVELKLHPKDFAIHTSAWTVPDGEFQVHVGSSSRDIRAEGAFTPKAMLKIQM